MVPRTIFMLIFFTGLATAQSTRPDWGAQGNQVDAQFGQSVASAGDVNGDGFADVVVGAANYDNGEENEDRVFVHLGSSSGLSPVASWTAESNQDNAYFGQFVSTAGETSTVTATPTSSSARISTTLVKRTRVLR